MQLTWHQILSYFTLLKRAESACFDTHSENNAVAVSVKLFSCNANHWYKALLCQVLTGKSGERFQSFPGIPHIRGASKCEYHPHFTPGCV